MMLVASLGVGGLLAYTVVLIARLIDSALWRRQLIAFQLELPRQLTHDQVAGWLAALGALTRHIPVVIEIDADQHRIRHVLAVPRFHAPAILHQARTMLPGLRAERARDYQFDPFVIRAAGELKVSSTSHPLGQERAPQMTSALLAALHPLAPGTRVRVAWLIAGTTIPHPRRLTTLAPDLARFRRLKTRTPLLRVCGRIGVSGDNARISRALLYRVYSTMRVLDAPGAALTRRILPWRVVASRLRDHSIPLIIWPAILNTRELAGLLGFPLDGASLPGLTGTVARQLPPTPEIPRGKLVLAHANYEDTEDRPIGLRQADRLHHLWLLGPTGSGKSEVIGNMAIQDARNGYGLVVIDPKTDLCENILARLPDERRDDVLVLNPAAVDRPIGFNILAAAHGEQERELIVDNAVRIFGEVWKASFGPRTADVLRNALLTLAATTAPDGSAFTLAEVAPLLEEPTFRRFVTTQPTVPATVRSFWHAYESMSAGERAQTIAPSLNKIRAITTRTSLRLMLGQSSGINLSDVFTKRRILLVQSNKGLVGSETAALFSSLVMASLWSAGLRRAGLPPSKRRPVWIYLDEFQDVLRIATDIADALAQARALGIGFTLAHQYLAQLSPALQAAVLGTVRSSMAFQLDQSDAKVLERRYAPNLTTDDLMGLRAYEVAMRLCVDGQVRPPVTGRTLPLGEPIHDAHALAMDSRRRFGSPRAVVEPALNARTQVPTDMSKPLIGRGHRENRV